MEGQKVRRPVLKFLDRYFARIVAGAGFVLGLAEGVTGQFTGVTRGECAGLVFCACSAGLFAFLPRQDPAKRRPSAKPYISPHVVRFDDEGITVTFKNKPHEAVRWADLVMVAITIRDGFLPMPFFMLAGSGCKGCFYPMEAVGAREMLHELQIRLPDFDNRAVIMAMGMMSGHVIVWEEPEWKAAQLKINAG